MNGPICGEQVVPGVLCHRPLHHDGSHVAEGEMPASIGMLFAEVMNRADAEWARANRAYRRYRTLGIVLLVLSGAQAALLLARYL